MTETAARANTRDSEAIKFLRDLRPKGRVITITSIHPDGGPTTTRTFTDFDKARRFIIQQNDAGRNIYYTLNLTGPTNIKPRKADIDAVLYLHVDADPHENETPEHFKQRMNQEIAKLEHEPTFTVDSGNGLQLLWEMKQLVTIRSDSDISDIESRNHALAVALGADPSTRNIDRILRVPGTTNYPNGKKRRIGRTKCRARYLNCTDKKYRVEDFPKHLENVVDKKRKQTKQDSDESELPANLRTLLLARGKGGFPSRHELVFAFLTGAIRARLADDIIINACIDPTYAEGGIYGHIKENGGRDCAERQLTRAREKVASDKTGHSWDDPDRSLLDDRRGKLPDFPIETIRPRWLREWLQKAAHGTGTTIDHVAVPLLGVASALVGAARKVQASKSWAEPCTLWVVFIGYSGTGKTPGIDATRKPLAQLEREREAGIAELKRRHDERVQRAAAATKRWQKKIEEAVARGAETPVKTDDAEKPGEFIAPRLFTTDVTVERMAQLVKARPQGMLLLTDELAGWFKNMSRYSGGTDNQFWLMAWDGRPYVVERMGRPPISIEHLLIGVLGGLQPDRLEVFDGPADGMSARFLFAWPGERQYRPLDDTIKEVDVDIVNLLDALSSLPERKPPRLPLAPDARALFERTRKHVHEKGCLFDGREREWFAKIPAQVLRLAGTLAYLDWASESGNDEPKEIKTCYINAAAKLVFAYFWPHARAALRQVGLSQRHADAKRVLRWLAAKQPAEVSREQVRRDALGQTRDADQTSTLLEQLVKAGWLRKVEDSASSPKGRRSAHADFIEAVQFLQFGWRHPELGGPRTRYEKKCWDNLIKVAGQLLLRGD